jgi:nicotinate-nucleotide adenylyltransferase|tara:strand:+ start:646 stop:1182 length:537 start_codon:yes stop_codon:yes gene_type:complete
LKKILKKKNKKIGILGGTFDPPHEGHLNISKIALKKLKLNEIIWLITKQNPLKQKPYLSVNIRKKLSKNLIKKYKKISIKYLDDLVKSKNTFDLLNFLFKKKKIQLYFLIGADNLVNFHKWKNWKNIPKLAKIVVFARPGYSRKALSSIAAKKLKKEDWIYLNYKKINISSSLIRKFW